jgi:hypothetical protein
VIGIHSPQKPGNLSHTSFWAGYILIQQAKTSVIIKLIAVQTALRTKFNPYQRKALVWGI